MKLLYLCNGEKAVNLRELPKGEAFVTERGKTLVDLCAFCLMSNHFHLVLREKQENGASQFMQKLATAYVMYFNEKYERTGALFEGPFKARHIDNDRYLKYMVAYLHLNPIDILDSGWKEKGIKDSRAAKTFLDKYPYSSYLEYTGGKRPESAIVNKSGLPKYFSSQREFDDFITDWLTMPKELAPKGLA